MLSSPQRSVGTALAVSSPHRPVWETESYPTEAATVNSVSMRRTQGDDAMVLNLPTESHNVRQPTESYNDLSGLMDDLTRGAQPFQTEAATIGRQPGWWNVASSPPTTGDDGASTLGGAIGQSQQIRRMGAGAMEMTSDLLGQELFE